MYEMKILVLLYVEVFKVLDRWIWIYIYDIIVCDMYDIFCIFKFIWIIVFICNIDICFCNVYLVLYKLEKFSVMVFICMWYVNFKINYLGKYIYVLLC